MCQCKGSTTSPRVGQPPWPPRRWTQLPQTGPAWVGTGACHSPRCIFRWGYISIGTGTDRGETHHGRGHGDGHVLVASLWEGVHVVLRVFSCLGLVALGTRAVQSPHSQRVDGHRAVGVPLSTTWGTPHHGLPTTSASSCPLRSTYGSEAAPPQQSRPRTQVGSLPIVGADHSNVPQRHEPLQRVHLGLCSVGQHSGVGVTRVALNKSE